MDRKLKRPRVVRLRNGRFMVLGDPSQRLDPVTSEPLVPIEPEPLQPITMDDLLTQPADPAIRHIPLFNLSDPEGRPLVAIVDAEDFERAMEHTWRGVRKWRKTRVYTRIPGCATYALSRFVLCVTDPMIHVRFRDGDSLNNRKANLEIRTP